MSTVHAFEKKLVSMIESGELKVERFQSGHSANYVSLIVGSIADKSRAGSIEPQYVSDLKKDEPEIDALMRRLLLSNLNLKNTLVPMYEIKPAVRELLLEAESISKSLEGDHAKLLAGRLGDAKTVDVYFADYEKLYRADSGLHIRLTSFAKPEHVQKVVDLGLYVKAATIVVPNGCDPLETAYEQTQNIDSNWTSNANVQSFNQQRRSSNVGDVMVFDGKANLVAMMGFTKLETFEPAAHSMPKVKRADKEDDSPSP